MFTATGFEGGGISDSFTVFVGVIIPALFFLFGFVGLAQHAKKLFKEIHKIPPKLYYAFIISHKCCEYNRLPKIC